MPTTLKKKYQARLGLYLKTKGSMDFNEFVDNIDPNIYKDARRDIKESMSDIRGLKNNGDILEHQDFKSLDNFVSKRVKVLSKFYTQTNPHLESFFIKSLNDLMNDDDEYKKLSTTEKSDLLNDFDGNSLLRVSDDLIPNITFNQLPEFNNFKLEINWDEYLRGAKKINKALINKIDNIHRRTSKINTPASKDYFNIAIQEPIESSRNDFASLISKAVTIAPEIPTTNAQARKEEKSKDIKALSIAIPILLVVATAMVAFGTLAIPAALLFAGLASTAIHLLNRPVANFLSQSNSYFFPFKETPYKNLDSSNGLKNKILGYLNKKRFFNKINSFDDGRLKSAGKSALPFLLLPVAASLILGTGIPMAFTTLAIPLMSTPVVIIVALALLAFAVFQVYKNIDDAPWVTELPTNLKKGFDAMMEFIKSTPEPSYSLEDQYQQIQDEQPDKPSTNNDMVQA